MKRLFSIGFVLAALAGSGEPRAWMDVDSSHELAYTVRTSPECQYPKDRLEEIVVVNIRRGALVPVIYPIVGADILLNVELRCFSFTDDSEFVYDLDVDFGLDNGEAQVLFVDHDYDSYGVLDQDGLGQIVDYSTMRAVSDFVAANIEWR